MTVVTLDPCVSGAVHTGEWVRAARPATLEGHTLGLVCNRLAAGEVMLDCLAGVLTDRYRVADVVKVVKSNPTVPLEGERWSRIVDRATVVVTGFGGCGSSVTRSLRDALELEAAGIPAVLLLHDALLPGVNELSRFLGVAHEPAMVRVGYPHNPTATWNKDECLEIAEAIAAAVHHQLVHTAAEAGLALTA